MFDYCTMKNKETGTSHIKRMTQIPNMCHIVLEKPRLAVKDSRDSLTGYRLKENGRLRRSSRQIIC